MKNSDHAAEMARRAERRAERSARTASLAPRLRERIWETTNVDAVKRANEKRKRRNLRRIQEVAGGGWS